MNAIHNQPSIPHDIGAERAVIGAVFLNPNVYHRLDSITASSFYREPHRLLWQVFAHLIKSGSTIDMVTVSGELERRKKMDAIGGYSYLAGFSASCPGVVDAPHYAEVMLRHERARELMTACHEALARLTNGDDPDEIAAEHQARVAEGAPPPDSCSWESETIELVMERIRHGGSDDVLPCHLPDINAEFGGAFVGEVTVIIAPPRTGKSVFGAQWAEHLSVDRGIPGCEFTLEMTREQETSRRLSRWGSIDYGKIQAVQRRSKGSPSTLTAQEWERLIKAHEKLAEAPLRTDESLLSIEKIWSRTKAGVAREGWRWIFVDHFHLVRPSPGLTGENEIRGHIARGLKALAKDCGVAVLVSAHMNKENIRRTDKRPSMGDIRHGGELEGIAATILGVYRDELFNQETSLRGVAEFSGVKARFGAGRSVRAKWEGRFQRFVPLVGGGSWDG